MVRESKREIKREGVSEREEEGVSERGEGEGYSRRKYYWCPKIRNNYGGTFKLFIFPIL